MLHTGISSGFRSFEILHCICHIFHAGKLRQYILLYNIEQYRVSHQKKACVDLNLGVHVLFVLLKGETHFCWYWHVRLLACVLSIYLKSGQILLNFSGCVKWPMDKTKDFCEKMEKKM